MDNWGYGSGGQVHSVRLDLDDLRASSFRWLVAAIAPLLWVLATFYQDERVATLVWPVAVIAVGVVAARLLKRSVALAGALLVAGLFAGLVGALLLYPGSLVPCFFSLVVLVAGMLLGSATSFGVAIASTILVIWGASGPRHLVTGSVLTAALLQTWAAFLIAWLTTKPVYTALAWAWSSYVRAVSQAEYLRDRQAELARTVKSLNEAYDRLEHLNEELARARQAAEEARRLKAEFVANISHELRTPLNVIVGFSEVMVMAPHTYGTDPLPAAYRADIHAIYDSAVHLSKLIDDVLDLSQIEAGRMGLFKEHLAMSEVVAEAAVAVAPLANAKRLGLETDIAPDLPPVLADRTRIRQVLINLLSNAFRFTDQGQVRIEIGLQGHEVVTSVSDTGPGIAPEDIPKAFEQFRQLDGSARRQHGGSGLGLAISKRFVEQHGGAMWVKSRPGQGSTFCFSLPLASQVAAISPSGDWQLLQRASRALRHAERRVAVVAQDEATARVFQRYLDGYHVVPARDGAPLRDLVAREACQAVIVATSSASAGWRHLQEAREGDGKVPVVVCSLPGRRDVGRDVHAAGYLVKPVTRERLLEALERLGSRVRHVLVVDDDPEIVRLLSRMVRSSPRGYRVSRATSGPEALVVLRNRRPDAVLLDLLMPEVNGYDILRAMRSNRRLRGVPVIVITARGAQEEAVVAGLLGVTRGAGLSVGELMGCLRTSLDALLAPSSHVDSAGEPAAAPAD